MFTNAKKVFVKGWWACFVISLSVGRIFYSLRRCKRTNEKSTKEIILVLCMKESWTSISCIGLKQNSVVEKVTKEEVNLSDGFDSF